MKNGTVHSDHCTILKYTQFQLNGHILRSLQRADQLNGRSISVQQFQLKVLRAGGRHRFRGRFRSNRSHQKAHECVLQRRPTNAEQTNRTCRDGRSRRNRVIRMCVGDRLRIWRPMLTIRSGQTRVGGQQSSATSAQSSEKQNNLKSKENQRYFESIKLKLFILQWIVCIFDVIRRTIDVFTSK